MEETDSRTLTLNTINSEEELLVKLNANTGHVSFWTSNKGKVFTLTNKQKNELVGFLEDKQNTLKKSDYFDYEKINFSELQIRIFEEILKNKEGINFEDLKNRFSMSVQGMQGHLGAMTAKWRAYSGSNDRMWQKKSGRYFAIVYPNLETPGNLEVAVSDNKKHYQSNNSKQNWEQNDEVFCLGCGEEIQKERLNAEPSARHCIECAKNLSTKKRKIVESWGSRDDWKRDRASWNKTNT